ncbi:MAG TPA: DNA-directed RNA polymerase subunit alpha C-terminal domain-containing protein [Gaiellaceae bacterium]|nr:DNA-directed RNA polymerase subunit alpha C-terminal domain-containing protein [Gaiellaceae bacterium]
MTHHRAGMKLGRDSAHGEAVYDVPIEELELGVHSNNCLKRVGIETIGDLVSRTEGELAAIPSFGKKSIDEVRETLPAHGLTLRGE